MKQFAFGERLQELLFENSINPEILSKVLNIELSAIYKWMRGDALPTFKNLIKLSDFFKCSCDFLAGKIDENVSSSFKMCPNFSGQFKFILNHFATNKFRLSKETKISRSVFHYWIVGKSEPTLDNLAKLAEHFDCTIDFIIGREK